MFTQVTWNSNNMRTNITTYNQSQDQCLRVRNTTPWTLMPGASPGAANVTLQIFSRHSVLRGWTARYLRCWGLRTLPNRWVLPASPCDCTKSPGISSLPERIQSDWIMQKKWLLAFSPFKVLQLSMSIYIKSHCVGAHDRWQTGAKVWKCKDTYSACQAHWILCEAGAARVQANEWCQPLPQADSSDPDATSLEIKDATPKFPSIHSVVGFNVYCLLAYWEWVEGVHRLNHLDGPPCPLPWQSPSALVPPWKVFKTAMETGQPQPVLVIHK